MSKQVNIRISEDLENQLNSILEKKSSTSLTKFIADAIVLAVSVENNMDPSKHSRLVIENPKDQPSEYKLLLKST